MTDPRMTPTNDAPVTVEQCDRDFAARWIVIPAQNVPRVQNGKWDDHPGVQAAARHRLAALASAPAERFAVGIDGSRSVYVQNADGSWPAVPTRIEPASAPAGDVPSDGTCRRCGSAPRDPVSALCATCTDEAPAGDGEYRVNSNRSGLERMTMMDDEMGLHDEPIPLSPNTVPAWHGEAFHKALLASSEPADPVSDVAILDLATEMLAREWDKNGNRIYADMIRNGKGVYFSSIAIRAIAAALARPRAAVGEREA